MARRWSATVGAGTLRAVRVRQDARIPAPGEKTWLIAGVLAYHVVLLGDICFC